MLNEDSESVQLHNLTAATPVQSDDDENLRKLLETCTEMNDAASSSANEATSCDENSHFGEKITAAAAKNDENCLEVDEMQEEHENTELHRMETENFCVTPDIAGNPVQQSENPTTDTPVQKRTTKGGGGGGSRKNKGWTQDEIKLFKIPLEVYNWRREMVLRSSGACDVYYYDPVDSKKLRSIPELKKFLAENKIDALSVDYFSFGKTMLNVQNEVVRTARPGSHSSNTSTATTSPIVSAKKKPAPKKATPVKTKKAALTPAFIEDHSDSSKSSFAADGDNPVSPKKPDDVTLPPQSPPADGHHKRKLLLPAPSIVEVPENEEKDHVSSDDAKAVENTNAKDDAIDSLSAAEKSEPNRKRLIPPSEFDEAGNGNENGLFSSKSPSSGTGKRRKIVSESRSAAKLAAKSKILDKKPKKKKVGKALKKALSVLDDSIESDDHRRDDEIVPPEKHKDSDETDAIASKIESDRDGDSGGPGGVEIRELSTSANDSSDTKPENSHMDKMSAIRREFNASGQPCETDTCDNRDTHDTICANCLLQFHLTCAVKRGRVVETSRDAYFICNPCYAELKSDGGDAGYSATGPNNNGQQVNNEIRQILRSVPANKNLHTGGALVSTAATSGRSNWVADACTYYQLMKMVFKHLIVVDLLKARLVCKTWNDICMSNDFWRIASLKGCQIREWSRAASFMRDRRVGILDFFGVKTSVQAFTVSLKDMDYLSGLHFGHVVPLVLYAIKDCTRVLSKLENLRFTVTEQRRPEKVSEIAVNFELFRHTINLRQLRIMAGKCFELRISNLSCVQTLTRLTHLTLLDVKVDDVTDWQFLKKLQNLQCLRIGSCANWTSKTYEIVSHLKNLEKLRLEIGETLPQDFLSQTLVALPKLKELCLVKFSINRVLMDLIASKKLTTLMIWPEFASKNAVQTWRHIVEGLAKQKHMKNFVIGVASKDLTVVRDNRDPSAKPPVEKNQTPLKFAHENSSTGSLKLIMLDEFIRYAKKYVPNVYNYHMKDDNVASTRIF